MPQWTIDQQRVISSASQKLICSAAAGSGKTAVMIERIVRLIREGADPFSFLVITFTNAAAAEMKEKIRKRLADERENPAVAAAAEKREKLLTALTETIRPEESGEATPDIVAKQQRKETIRQDRTWTPENQAKYPVEYCQAQLEKLDEHAVTLEAGMGKGKATSQPAKV